MQNTRVRCTSILLVASLGAASLGAEEILFLKNGRHIVVDRYWEEGDQILYERNGSTFGFPQRLLDRVAGAVDSAGEPIPSEPGSGFRNAEAAEAIEAAKQSARNGNLSEAARLYRQALEAEPTDFEIRIDLGSIYLEQGDLYAAEAQLEQAKRLAPENPRVLELLGDVYYRQGRLPYAVREWQEALANRPEPGLLRKLQKALSENDEDINFANETTSRARFLIRYEGRVDEVAGRLVAAALEEEHLELRRELRFSPPAPVTVTLYTTKGFVETGQVPEWASALNDGEIRIPVENVVEMTPKLRRLLRHELTHSFVNAMTAGNCPAWLHEGIAQQREGIDSTDAYARVRAARAEGKLLSLWNLEGALLGYSTDEARLAYAQALAATDYLAARRGSSAISQILKLLAEGRTMNEALRRVVGLDYHEFQAAWEADLGRY
jgi:tetratricopeptide (TPR) repeat protein